MLGWIENAARALVGAGLWWGIGVSLGLFVLSLAGVTVIVVAWHPDHFRAGRQHDFLINQAPVVRALGLFAKNLAGVLFVVLGLVMSVPGIPGQGFLTVLIGLTLVDFPGKLRLERKIIGRPAVLRAVNGLRRRFRKPPLVVD